MAPPLPCSGQRHTWRSQGRSPFHTTCREKQRKEWIHTPSDVGPNPFISTKEAQSNPYYPSGRGDGPIPSAPWLEPGTEWRILKADVAKAHRRIKIHPQDRRYQPKLVTNGGSTRWARMGWQVPSFTGAHGSPPPWIIWAVFTEKIDWGLAAWLLRARGRSTRPPC